MKKDRSGGKREGLSSPDAEGLVGAEWPPSAGFQPEDPSSENTDPDEARGRLVLSRRAVFLWSAALAFLMAWVFTLGVLVGRGSIFKSQAFKDLEERLAVSKTKDAAPPVVEVTEETQPPRPAPSEPKLTFYGSLSETRPQPEKSRPQFPQLKKRVVMPKPVAPKETPRAPPPAKPHALQAEVKPEAPGRPRLVVTSGVKTVEPEDSAAPPPRRAPNENFTIQVAAVPTAEQAAGTVRRLKAKGFDAYYYQVELKGRRYFRVRVGRFNTRAEAQALMGRLEAAGHKSMFVSALTD